MMKSASKKFAISLVRSRQKLVCSTADLTKSIGEKKLAPGLPGVRSLENLYGLDHLIRSSLLLLYILSYLDQLPTKN